MSDPLISLTPLDLGIAGVLVLLLAAAVSRLGFDSRPLLINALRMTLQLLFIGYVLKLLFAISDWYWVMLLGLVMAGLAGREVMQRQKRRFTGWWGIGLGTASLSASAFLVAILALLTIIGPEPWYEPQYAIPLLGMLLGNCMSGISLSLDRLTETAWRERHLIEARLMLGHVWHEAVVEARRESLRSGLMPIVNSMAAAGIISLPGMMTGQILAGSPPIEAVKYQIMIFLLIVVATGLGTVIAVWAGSRHLFDERMRLRLDRLESKGV
ncbi:MAG: iron export ABC transporter permease subunit FetB [Gammaproteobacteria bacterium]|jgi:putative ABC transport system permease protein